MDSTRFCIKALDSASLRNSAFAFFCFGSSRAQYCLRGSATLSNRCQGTYRFFYSYSLSVLFHHYLLNPYIILCYIRQALLMVSDFLFLHIYFSISVSLCTLLIPCYRVSTLVMLISCVLDFRFTKNRFCYFVVTSRAPGLLSVVTPAWSKLMRFASNLPNGSLGSESRKICAFSFIIYMQLQSQFSLIHLHKMSCLTSEPTRFDYILT